MQEYQYKQKKRRLLIFSILGICLFLFLRWEPIQWTLWAMTLAIRDIGRSPNMKADDAISKAIYQEMGDSVYYKGKRETVEELLSIVMSYIQNRQVRLKPSRELQTK